VAEKDNGGGKLKFSCFISTGVARDFDWEGPKIEKTCDASLVSRWRNNDDITDMTS